MTVKELIYTHDMDKIVDACCALLPDYVDPEKWRAGLYDYLNKLKEVEPIYSKSIVLSRKVTDCEGESYWDACSIVDFDPEKLIASYNNVQEYKKKINEAYEIFSTDYDKWNELFYAPLQYAMEFSPAKEILGHQVTLRGIPQTDIYMAIAAIVDEMTFFGFDEQVKEDEFEKVSKTAQEVEEILQKPQEEQENYFCTIADLFPGIELTEPTEEEKAETRRHLVNECFANIEYLYDVLCKIQWCTCETLYIKE